MGLCDGGDGDLGGARSPNPPPPPETEALATTGNEEGLRNHGVDAFPAIDHLGNAEIDGHAAQHVGVIASQVLFVDQEIDHFPHGHLGRFFQVLVKPHRDVVGRCFGPRPPQADVFADDEAEGAVQRGLDRREVHFAVSLPCVPVSHLEQPTLRMDRNEQRRAGDQLFVVHVAGVDPRRRAADAS